MRYFHVVFNFFPLFFRIAGRQKDLESKETLRNAKQNSNPILLSTLSTKYFIISYPNHYDSGNPTALRAISYRNRKKALRQEKLYISDYLHICTRYVPLGPLK